MQFLRILFLPLLSILLVSENHALAHIYSPPLGLSSSVKNNAKELKKAKETYGGYSHTIGEGLPGTPISMENINTPKGEQHINSPQDLRNWMADQMSPPTNSHKLHRARPLRRVSGAENRSIFNHLCKRKRPISARAQGAEEHRIRAYYLYVRIPSTGGNEAPWMLCGLLHKMAESRSSLAERNKQMVMEGGDNWMGKEDPLDHRFLDGKHYDFDLPCDEKAFRQALAEKCAKNPAWQAYKAKGDDIGRRQIENELEKEAMQASLDFFQEVNERAAAAHQRLFMGVTRMGSYFIHPIFGVAYNNFLDKKVPVWDDTKAAYSYFGEGQYGQAACHAGMAALDATVIGKTGKGIWMGVRRWGGPKVGVPQSSKLPFDVDALLKNAAEPNRNGLTNAGRGLQKHADRFGEALSDIKFSGKTANRDAQKIIEEILKSPNRVIEPIIEKGGYRVYDSVTKQCFDVSRTGIFNGFRKAPGLDNIIK